MSRKTKADLEAEIKELHVLIEKQRILIDKQLASADKLQAENQETSATLELVFRMVLGYKDAPGLSQYLLQANEDNAELAAGVDALEVIREKANQGWKDNESEGQERKAYTRKKYRQYLAEGLAEMDARKEANIDRALKYGQEHRLCKDHLRVILKD